jgi:hypothetical protein
MKDRLEEFISKNRDQFDLYEPGTGIWTGIESRIHKRRTTLGWKGIIWRAAAVVIIFTSSFLLQEYLHFRKDQLATQKENLYREIPELYEADIYYSSLLEEKIRQVEPLLSAHPGLGETLNQDLSELDRIYYELQQDLRDNIANDEIIEAMIQNYILKTEILEDLLEYLDGSTENNETKNGQNEI